MLQRQITPCLPEYALAREPGACQPSPQTRIDRCGRLWTQTCEQCIPVSTVPATLAMFQCAGSDGASWRMIVRKWCP
jgi:hypothetical protein